MEGVRRGLLGRLQRDLATSPVVLLEGLRAVGKTWLAHELVDNGFLRSFVDLTDENTLERVRDDPAGSLSAVATPAAIDEVQLAPGLLLAVKRIVDATTENGTFLLTSSARVRTDDLGGTDPLVGRITRSRLRPLTQAERAGTPVDLVDRIFGARLSPTRYPAVSHGELESRMATGGLPTMPGVLTRGSSRIRRRRLTDYVERTLAPQPGLARRDQAGLSRAFRYLAGKTSQILVVERVASQLAINRKTVDAYLDDLEARFLLERLPAWRPTPSAAARAHPKLHVTDSGIASLMGGLETPGDGTEPSFGGRVESFVVMELLTQASWGDLGIEAFHWRDPASRTEVDLVLVDAEGRAVAIEIKASTTTSKADLRGIDAFAEQCPLTGGVVFYSGSEMRQLAPGRWAVPISALWTDPAAPTTPAVAGDKARPTAASSALPPPTPDPPVTRMPAVEPHTEPPPSPSDAALFLSYVHADDQTEHGRITALAGDIGSRYELLTGESLQVFTDRDIAWGEQWQLRLGQELAQTTFFVPVVTPRFLTSRSCRDEVLEFTAKATALGLGEFVMPIRYIPTSALDDETDPVAVVLRGSQWQDWNELRYSERTSGDYRRGIDNLVERLRSIRDGAVPSLMREAGISTRTRETASDSDPVSEVDASTSDGDLLDLAETSVALVAELERRMDALTSSFTGLGEQLEAVTPALERAGRSPSPRQLRSVLRTAVQPLKEPIDAVEEASREATRLLTRLDAAVSQVIVACEDPGTRQVAGLDDLLQSILDLDELEFDVSELGEVRGTARALATVAREVRPLAHSVESILRVFSDFDAMRSRWAADARRVLDLPEP